MNEEELFKAANAEFGVQGQFYKLVEACIKTASAFSGFNGSKVVIRSLAKPLVEVELMLEQVKLILRMPKVLADARAEKIEELKKRVDADEDLVEEKF